VIGWLRRRRLGTDEGMVTAEAAVTLPALLFLALAAVAAIAVAGARVHCVDAAREAARAGARGQAPPVFGRTEISVVRTAETTTATARLLIRPARWLPSLAVTETAVAVSEPEVVP